MGQGEAMGSGLLSRQLEYFVATYQARNIARAAQAIPITYQGLKKALNNLERDLSVKLFETSENGTLTPTAEADLIYDFALQQMNEAKRVEALIRHESAPVRTVRLCAAIGVVAYLGYDLMGEFNDVHPDCRLDVTEVYDTAVDGLVASGEFSLGIAVFPFPDGLSFQPLASNGCIAWVSLDNPLSRKDSLRIEDLDGQCVMIPNRQIKANQFFRDTFKQKGIVPKHIATCPDPFASYLFAKENQGIGIGVDDSPAYGSADDRVKQLPVEDGYLYEFAIAHRRTHTLTADEIAVSEYLKERAARRKRQREEQP